jgi:hypothetical protein
MEEKLYPKEQLDEDLAKVEGMDIPRDLKVEKQNSLVHLYQNQNKEWMVEHFSIADHRANIIGTG